MKYSVVLIEDEPLGIAVLKSYLEDEIDFHIEASFTDPAAGLCYLNKYPTDLLLLDIDMPLLNGFQLLDSALYRPLTILTTAHKKYLQDGFDYGVLDYLQKPIKKERFKQALLRAKQELEQRRLLKTVQDTTAEQLYIKSGQKEFYIKKDDVLFIKGLKDYCTLYLNTQEKIVVSGSLKTFLSINNPEGWLMRIHKSYAVTVKNITSLNSTSELHIKAYSIPIGRKYKEELLRWFRGANRRYVNQP